MTFACNVVVVHERDVYDGSAHGHVVKGITIAFLHRAALPCFGQAWGPLAFMLDLACAKVGIRRILGRVLRGPRGVQDLHGGRA